MTESVEILESFAHGEPVFSFEFYLPKAPEQADAFLNEVRTFKTLKPSFVSLTYGAGGSARERTIDMVGRMQKEVVIETVCHLTGITHTRAEMTHNIERIRATGIRNIMALRGDPPQEWTGALPEDFPHAVDLVRFIRKAGGFRMAVAGYPEGHPQAPSRAEDIKHLAAKVRAGADWVVTQLFFDNRHYFDFLTAARQEGITVPIVPGIMPVTSYAQLKRFTTLCGVSIPPSMAAHLEEIQHDAAAVVRYGIDWASRQCLELLDHGAPGIHFYTLNRSHSTAEILSRLKK